MASHARKDRRSAMRAGAAPVKDSFVNLEARLGIGADNLSSASNYQLNPLTRKRAQLEFMYRGSWIVGAAVDAVADDMTRAGVDIAAVIPPNDIDVLNAAIERTEIWQSLGNAIRWARLYGGAVAVVLIDGQDLATELRVDAVTRGQFKGLYVLDRWMALPSAGSVISEFGPDLGKPAEYTIQIDAPALKGQRVHHSRVLRFDGIELPYWQRVSEQGWGMSVIERFYDRLVAFDSTTQGAAQLVFKAHLRTLKVEGLTQILGAGGPGLEALAKNVEAIRRFQSTEGLSVVDAKDDFQTHSYTFSGLADMLLQLGEQISGALQIPLVRLFGQSPAGLSASGESDLRTYYDGIISQQESKLRGPVRKVLDVLFRSEFGAPPPEGFNFAFNPLWQTTDREKAEIAGMTSTAVLAAFDSGVIDRKTALSELRQSSDVTGVFSNITDDDIADAENDPPPIDELAEPGSDSDNPGAVAPDVRPGGAGAEGGVSGGEEDGDGIRAAAS